MSDKREMPEEEELGAPLYMLSFADMMTNILCFFILLCAFSKEKMIGLISDGVGSFQSAVTHQGMPGVLPGDRLPIDLGANRVLFRPSKSVFPKLLVDKDGRISDTNRDSLRQVIVQSLKRPETTELPLPFIFVPGSAELSEVHKTVLKEVAPRLVGGNFDVRVEGYAFKEGMDEESSWELSAQRAENVARFLALAGPIASRRLVPIGYGPPQSRNELVMTQQRWGRRVVIISFVTPVR